MNTASRSATPITSRSSKPRRGGCLACGTRSGRRSVSIGFGDERGANCGLSLRRDFCTTQNHNCEILSPAPQYRHHSAPSCTSLQAVRTGVVLCSGQVFSSALLLASGSGLQRMSCTIGVSERHSLPIFRQRNVKNSRVLRVSGATGTTFETCCTTSLRQMVQQRTRVKHTEP